jgi:hypothetical protein
VLERRLEKSAVLLLAAAGAVAILLMAFCTERRWGTEERALYNIPFTFVHDGKLAFPAYSFQSKPSFDRLYIHPPTHYGEISLLMKLGLPLYYAEAVPVTLVALLCLFLIVTANFPAYIQLGLISGLLAAMGWIASLGGYDYTFHLRPDLQLALALLAGLVALEASRAQSWETKRLFFGSFLLTYGSTIHYPGWPAWLGLGVFSWYAWRDPARKLLARRLLTGAAGACLAGVPYAAYMLHNWEFVRTFSSSLSLAKTTEIIAANFPVYRTMGGAASALPAMFYAWPVAAALAAAVPPFAIAALLLFVHRRLRAMALAFLPFCLFLFAFLGRKSFPYFYLECILAITGVWLLVALLWGTISARLPLRAAAAPAFSLLFLIGYVTYTPELRIVRFQIQRHEYGELRALAKEVVGRDATIACVHSNWYLSGATRWFDLTDDLLRSLPAMDLRTYCARFDAIAVAHDGGMDSQAGVNESTLYADGVLTLRGFGASGISPLFRWFWLSPRKEKPVAGFFWQNRELFRFREAVDGDHAVTSLLIPGDPDPWIWATAPIEFWWQKLPKRPGQQQAPGVMAILLFDNTRFQSAAGKLAGAKIIETIRGRVERVPPPYPRQNDAQDRLENPRSYAELLSTWAQPAQPPMQTYLNLQAMTRNAEVSTSTDGQVRVSASRPASGQGLVFAGVPALKPGRYYRVTFDLTTEAGGMEVGILPKGAGPAPVFARVVPCRPARESFVYQYPGGPPAQFVISAYNPFRDVPVRFEISSPLLEEVQLSR